MELTVGGTIPVAQYGNLTFSIHTDVEHEYQSFESAWNHMTSIYDMAWNQYADKKMAKDVGLATEEQLRKLAELADITHMHSLIENMDRMSEAKANFLIDILKQLSDTKQEQAKESRRKQHTS